MFKKIYSVSEIVQCSFYECGQKTNWSMKFDCCNEESYFCLDHVIKYSNFIEKQETICGKCGEIIKNALVRNV